MDRSGHRRQAASRSIAWASVAVLMAALGVGVCLTRPASAADVHVANPAWSSSGKARPRPTVTPTPTSSPTPTPTASPTQSATMEPSPTVTASPRPTASVTQSPTASPSTATTSPSPTASTSQTRGPSSCASGAAPVEYGGSSYCPGYVFAVRRTLYGVDTRTVLRGVVVESVSGSQVRIAGGPSCLPTEWCGQTIPSMTVTFPIGAAVPTYADVISLYGTTITGGLTPGGFETTGHCDPYWGDC